MQQEFLFELGESGVYQWHHSHWRRLCSPLEIVSCIRLNLPMATPQTWLTIRFELADGSSRQALVLKHVIGGDHFWPLLGDFYQDGFQVHKGCEELVQQYLLQAMENVHQFELNHSLPSSPIHLSSNNGPAWAGLYRQFVAPNCS
ncbi:MAG: hypothetical protein VYE29_13840 [Pseudomonadota bacterium]|nr:hypothetical protein [Pseudomonadota bacterium]